MAGSERVDGSGGGGGGEVAGSKVSTVDAMLRRKRRELDSRKQKCNAMVGWNQALNSQMATDCGDLSGIVSAAN